MTKELNNILEKNVKENSSIYLAFDENDLLKGGIAKLTLNGKSIIRMEEANTIFDRIKEASAINFGYTNGACHDRSHWMSLLLEKWKISHFKVWNFAPSRYSFISNKKLWIKDALGLNENGLISSGYHVAPAVFTNGEILVFDPVIHFEKPLSLKQWLMSQHCNESMYTIIDADWYSFNSFNGLTLRDFGVNGKVQEYTMPYWFPNIITGDFFKYNGLAKKEGWMEQGLAILDLAIVIYNNHIAEDLKRKKEMTRDMILLLASIENIEALFRYKVQNQFINMRFINRYNDLIKSYSVLYDQLVQQWKERVIAQ